MQRDSSGQTFAEFQEHLFEAEYCDECGLDNNHQPVILFGLWFAQCNPEAVLAFTERTN